MAAVVTGTQGTANSSERLLEALEQVGCALTDRRAWDSGHTTIFELLRRACLDASNSGDLEAISAEDSQLEGAWLFLCEERRLHPIRKKRVKECVLAFGAAGRWLQIFRESMPIREALHRLDPGARMELLEATSSQDLAAECSTPQAQTGSFAHIQDEAAAEPACTFWSDGLSPHANSLIEGAKAGEIQFSRRNPFVNRETPAGGTEKSEIKEHPISPKGHMGRQTLQAAMAPESLVGQHAGEKPPDRPEGRNPFRTVTKVNGGGSCLDPGGISEAPLSTQSQGRQGPTTSSNPFLPVKLNTFSAEKDSTLKNGNQSNKPFDGKATVPLRKMEGSDPAAAKRQSGNNPFSVQARQQWQQQQQQPKPSLVQAKLGPTANPVGKRMNAAWPPCPGWA
mmetsp:Transcript_110889/g.214734  ORF Transcript_110889/g.214734 Transcript_110889/m.214734 type:complete len:395 (-) Transcript_110889:71-1255(-)